MTYSKLRCPNGCGKGSWGTSGFLCGPHMTPGVCTSHRPAGKTIESQESPEGLGAGAGTEEGPHGGYEYRTGSSGERGGSGWGARMRRTWTGREALRSGEGKGEAGRGQQSLGTRQPLLLAHLCPAWGPELAPFAPEPPPPIPGTCKQVRASWASQV